MDSTLVAAYIGAGSAIAGVILGSAISGFGNWRERSRRRKNVRRVLSWEHAYNIAILEDFWKRVNQEDQSQDVPDYIKEYERNLRLTEEKLEDWRHLMWQSYSGEVASVLSEDEFNQSYGLHSSLDKFSSQRQSIAEIIIYDYDSNAMRSYRSYKRMQGENPGFHPELQLSQDKVIITMINEQVRPLWDECVKLHNSCHKIGNPI